jgi:hypothetical protein
LETPPPPQVVVNTVEPAAQPPPVHDPLTQVEPEPHAFPQLPQLLVSVCSLTQAPLQREKPVLHAKVHVPLEHVAVALATPVVHAVGVLQVPFVWHVSTPLPLHVVCPGAHTPVQAPLTQVWLVQLVTVLQVPFD